ncbi:hypothetical protein NKJ74_25730 [Mesorhizobium sp. M0046]|uniref:hypothetical protein n=1 Tax=Mesorhizobium sp. M0046 TaxID=2956858 RepID=UPI003337F1F4
MLRQIKFEPVAFHSIEDRALNFIEQINQTWTFAVAIGAARQLLQLHPNIGGFRLAPGAHASLELDIMSVELGEVGAETFAAATPRNNGKLGADLAKLAGNATGTCSSCLRCYPETRGGRNLRKMVLRSGRSMSDLRTARPPVEDVITGLTTKSARIRALALAGYERAEIARMLEIRYQHVRKVLVDEEARGAQGQRPRSAGKPKAADHAAASPRLDASPAVLIKAGFRPVGEWTRLSDEAFHLSERAPNEPGIYAFAVDGAVKYIGLTQTGLHARMGPPAGPQRPQDELARGRR